MRRARTVTLAVTMLGSAAAPAFADATLFVGANTTPVNRAARGFAIGAGVLLFGIEFEYAGTVEDTSAAAPGLTTGMGNVLLQTPFTIFGFQPYGTIGAGIYHESLGTRSETSFGMNTGGGVKVSLVGPIRLRVDYRVIKLGDGAL